MKVVLLDNLKAGFNVIHIWMKVNLSIICACLGFIKMHILIAYCKYSR